MSTQANPLHEDTGTPPMVDPAPPAPDARSIEAATQNEARLADQRALLEDKILEMTRCGIDIAHRDEFEAAITQWKGSAILAARFLTGADNEENALLLASDEKSAERRKAAAELGSNSTRLEARIHAITAEADKQRVLYLVNRARQGAT